MLIIKVGLWIKVKAFEKLWVGIYSSWYGILVLIIVGLISYQLMVGLVGLMAGFVDN